MREIGNLVLVCHIRSLEIVVHKAPLCIFGKGRMRSKSDAGADVNLVHRLRYQLARSCLRQRFTGFVEVLRRRHFACRTPGQLIRTLEVVVAIRRLIDLVGIRRLVIGVRAGRVQVLGRAAGKGQKQGITCF